MSDDTIAENTFSRAALNMASAAINAVYPDARAGAIDCICCIEDYGVDLIDLAGDTDPMEVISNATVYGQLPWGTYLTVVGEGLVQLTRREVRA